MPARSNRTPRPTKRTRKSSKDLPDGLRIFNFHRINGLQRSSGDQWVADCPFCGREGKLGLRAGKSQFNCIVCEQSGNNYQFIRDIWQQSLQETTPAMLSSVFKEFDLPGKARPFVRLARKWGLAKHTLSGEWCLPGYNETGAITGLYVWRSVPTKGAGGATTYKHQLRASPGMGQHILGYEAVFGDQPAAEVPVTTVAELDIAEGWRDGVAWTLASGRPTISVPGVSSWKPTWQPVAAGRIVNILFDNDYPTKHPSKDKEQQLGGPMGVDKVASRVLVQEPAAKQVRFLNWADTMGAGGELDPEQAPASSKLYAKGADLRDLCTGAPTALYLGSTKGAEAKHTSRVLEELQDPVGWLKARLWEYPPLRAVKQAAKIVDDRGEAIRPKPCTSWVELIGYWKKAMRWRRDLEDALAVMLATAVSTTRIGDQLMVMVIGQPGGGKTRLCEAMLVSDKTMPLEMLSGIISGWKSGQGAGKRYSLLERGNRLCWITPEADTMVKSDNYAKEMGKIRRAFDGKMTADFKTMDESMEFNDLRFTWIKAGTPKMLTHDMAGLGDRFLKIRISAPEMDESMAIVDHVIKSAWNDVAEESEGERQMSEAYCEAYARTAGYLDHLLQNADKALKSVRQPDAEVLEELRRLGYLVAYFRARPEKDEEVEDVVEQPTRVSAQLTRFMRCLSAVFNEEEISDNTVRVVQKLANDSAAGYTLDIAKVLAENGASSMKAMEIHSNHTKNLTQQAVMWLTRIKVIKLANSRRGVGRGAGNRKSAMWDLTEFGEWVLD